MRRASDPRSAARRALAVGTIAGIVIGYGAARLATRLSDSGATPVDSLIDDTESAAEVAQQEQEQLLALGYAAGSATAPEVSGVTTYERGTVYEAYNIFTSGDRPAAYLMDMGGNVVHEWSKSFAELWPNRTPGEQNVSYWRRVHVFDNGDVLAIIEPEGIFRLDKDSNLLWEYHCGAHHDFVVEPDGRVFVLAREKQMFDLEDGRGMRPVLVDFICELDSEGKELRRISLLEAFQHTEYRALLQDVPDDWDIFHTNSLERLRARGMLPAFQFGRFLVSIRELGTVALVDFESGGVVWALKGQWLDQHEATLTDTGNVLLFDNRGHRGRSKVIEINPHTQEIVWSYGMTEGQTLNSPVCGLAQRLPNGNTLITDAVPGRVIEVGPEGTIAWQFVNPHRAGEKAELIATVMDFQRLSSSFKPDWLGSDADMSLQGANR